jgi:hypothetical protein
MEASPSMSCRNLRIGAFTLALLIGIAWPSTAQLSAPYGGRVALGAAVGGALPVGDLENGLFAGGTFLVSLASHVALSAEAGANWVDVNRPGFRSDLMPQFADLNLSFQWRRGPFRPFLIGGVGVYRYTITVSADAFADPALRSALIALGLSPTGRTGPIETRHDERGANIGGGFEYFFTRRSALTMSVREHRVRNFVLVAPFDGDFVNVAVGFRQYL